MKPTYYYVYYQTYAHNDQKITMYDRTMGTQQAAEERVATMKKMNYLNPFYSTEPVKGAYY